MVKAGRIMVLPLILLFGCARSISPLDPSNSAFFKNDPSVKVSYAASFDIAITLSAPALLHYMVMPSGHPAPSSDEIISGRTATGLLPVVSSACSAGPSETELSVQAYLTNTAYDVYVCASSSHGLTELCTSVYKLSATTASAYQYKSRWGSMGTNNGEFTGNFGGNMCEDGDGNIYVTCDYQNKVQKFDAEGNFLLGWGEAGTGNGQFNESGGICCGTDGYIYVTDLNNHRVQKFDRNGNYMAQWACTYPVNICSDTNGNFYVIQLSTVSKFSANGDFILQWGSAGSNNGQFANPMCIAADRECNIYVTDSDNRRVQKFSANGVFITNWGSDGYGDGQFAQIWGISSDKAGAIYVSDCGNNRIQKFSPNGVFLSKWGIAGSGDGEFGANMRSVLVTSAGYVYVADTGNYRIQKFR